MKAFKGILFHPDLADGKSECEVVLQRSSFQLKPEQNARFKTYEIRFDRAEVWRGGAANKLVFFKSKDHPELSFYVHESTGLLKTLDREHPEAPFRPQVRKLMGKSFSAQMAFYGAILSLVGLLFLGYSSWGGVIGSAAKAVPFAWEKKLGDRLVGNFVTPLNSVEDQKLNAELKKLLATLKPGVGDFYSNFTFHIVKDSDLNAFALPGGHIVFNSGMLLSAETAEEILGVTAHEMAHVTERHIMRSIISSIGVWGVAQLLIGDFSGIIAILINQSEFLLRQSFSRANEQEADTVGFATLVASKVDPRGLSSFFQRILDKHGKNGSLEKVEKYTRWLSTHPETEARIKEVAARYEKLENKALLTPVKFPLKAFQAALKRVAPEEKEPSKTQNPPAKEKDPHGNKTQRR